MNELFYGISEEHQNKILQLLEAHTTSYKKNNTILSNVPNEHFIYIVLSGYLQIIKNNYDGSTRIVEELPMNSIFGTMTSPLQNKEYSVITKEDSKVISIDLDSVFKIEPIESFDIFLKNLLSTMIKKMEEIAERSEILANNSIRNKLLAYFKIMSKKNNTKVIYLPFSYTSLADYLIVNRSAMSRELKNLKEEGFIEVKGKKIKLLYDIV